jgi:NAD(P)-dependent dehydrogenase (short-subunit alcohol dehydrogenase family)
MGTLDLTGQVAVVTGGGGGIGRGIAERLAAQGADVSVLDIDAERAAFVAGNVQQLGRQSMVHTVDVMDADALMTAVESTAEHFGRIDILVNNAGGVSGRKFLEQSQRSWRRHIDINLVSMLAATHAAAPHMIAGGRGGSIVNVASIEATRAAPMFAVYAACKAGMLSFTRSMALELSEHQIRVNSIGPDFTITPGNSGFRSGPVPEPIPPREPQRASVSSTYIPLGREGTIEECGDLAVFLCSGMASYITGTHIPIDGGTWASSGWTASPDGKWSLFGPSAMFDSGI